VHLTETCEKDSPHLITHVETTTAPVSDDARTATIHEGLKHKDLLPSQHIVETGYVDAQLLHRSQEDFGIDLVGPTRPDVKWQAQQQTGFDAGHFAIDWQAEQATCPEGHTSISWTPAIDNRKNEGDLDQVLDHRLSGLSQSFLVYALDSDPASHHHGAPSVAPPGVPTCTGAHQNGRLQSPLCTPRWSGRNHFTRSARDGPAPLSLYWPRKNASPARSHGCCDEYRSSDALARWGASCSDEALGFGSVASSCCLKDF
jgi:hypothetical protein